MTVGVASPKRKKRVEPVVFKMISCCHTSGGKLATGFFCLFVLCIFFSFIRVFSSQDFLLRSLCLGSYAMAKGRAADFYGCGKGKGCRC